MRTARTTTTTIIGKYDDNNNEVLEDKDKDDNVAVQSPLRGGQLAGCVLTCLPAREDCFQY